MKPLDLLPLLLLLGIPAVAAPPRYRVTDLGALSGPKSEAIAINNCGEVVGNADTNVRSSGGNFLTHAFLWRRGRLIDLGAFDGKSSRADGINNRGQIVGTSNQHGFLWSQEQGRRLIRATFCRRLAINDKGDVAGAEGPSTPEKLFVLRNGIKRWLSVGDVDSNTVTAINSRGQVLINSLFSANTRITLWQKNRHKLIHSSTADDAGYGINKKGQIVGRLCRTAYSRAFLWNRGQISLLGSLGAQNSEAHGINGSTEVVGTVYDSAPDVESDDTAHVHSRAFFWQSGKMYDLNKCIPQKSGWTLSIARGINNHGWIVGTGIHNGHTRAFLLTPGEQ